MNTLNNNGDITALMHFHNTMEINSTDSKKHYIISEVTKSIITRKRTSNSNGHNNHYLNKDACFEK